MNLSKQVIFIIEKIESCGYEAFVVGGAVRDSLLNITPHDYDIGTNASINEIENIFSFFDAKVIVTGINYGTVTVFVDKIPTEVTTYRTESCYANSRHPSSVTFVNSIKEDLLRRDFTINAIAYNPKTGYVDPFNGVKDIESHLLRTVGDSHERFFEDALRIMRLFRFASTTGFSIEPSTLKSACDNAELLKKISVERIAIEISKTLAGNNPFAINPLIACDGLKFIGIEPAVIPATKYEEIRIENINIVTKSENIAVKWFFLLWVTGDNIENSGKLLKFSNDLKRKLKYLKLISEYFLADKFDQTTNIRLLIYKTNIDLVNDFLEVLEPIIDVSTAKKLLKKIITKKMICSFDDLAINGNDIAPLVTDKTAIGAIKNQLFLEVISDKIDNRREILITRAKDIIKTL